MLGHGAGGGVAAPDLIAAAESAFAMHIAVALIEQPYRVAGWRSPPPAPRLGAAWTAILENLAAHELPGLTLIAGGRSSGTRVACRTAAAAGACGVLCLSLPLQPAARAGAAPRPSRLSELEAVAVPVLVAAGRSSARIGLASYARVLVRTTIEGIQRAIHAMPVRPTFRRLLEP